jgi:hypothetical protein
METFGSVHIIINALMNKTNGPYESNKIMTNVFTGRSKCRVVVRRMLPNCRYFQLLGIVTISTQVNSLSDILPAAANRYKMHPASASKCP